MGFSHVEEPVSGLICVSREVEAEAKAREVKLGLLVDLIGARERGVWDDKIKPLR